MANPRTTPEYEGIAGTYETFITDNSTITYSATTAGGSAVVGRAVMLSADRTVALTTDGSRVLGKLIKVESDNRGVIQTGGYMTLPSGAGAALTIGRAIVGDLDSATPGYIREAASGTAAETINERGSIIDNDVTTAVVVRL